MIQLLGIAKRSLRVGDRVIYRKPKVSYSPGPRAKNIWPADNGDCYYYSVDKFWTVNEILDKNTIVAKTRRGKQHRLSVRDPLLRKASLLDHIFYGSRFPESTY